MRPYYNPEHEVRGGNLLDVGRDGLQLSKCCATHIMPLHDYTVSRFGPRLNPCPAPASAALVMFTHYSRMV
jgi:hypothetical protein